MQVRIEKVVNCDWSILYTLILFATTTLVNEAFFITGRVVTCPTMTGVTGEISSSQSTPKSGSNHSQSASKSSSDNNLLFRNQHERRAHGVKGGIAARGKLHPVKSAKNQCQNQR